MDFFKVNGTNTYGEWTVIRGDGNLCNGTWKTKSDAESWCEKHNNKKQWERVLDE